MFLKKSAQINENIIRLHEVLGHPFYTSISSSTVQINRTDSGIKRLHSLRDERSKDSGQNIAASSFCKSGISGLIDEGTTICRSDDGVCAFKTMVAFN